MSDAKIIAYSGTQTPCKRVNTISRLTHSRFQAVSLILGDRNEQEIIN